MVITTAEAIGCDDMVVNSLFIVLSQVEPMGGGREGGRLFEDINPVHTPEQQLTHRIIIADVTFSNQIKRLLHTEMEMETTHSFHKTPI